MNTHRESSTITNAACVTLQVSSTCIMCVCVCVCVCGHRVDALRAGCRVGAGSGMNGPHLQYPQPVSLTA